MSETITDQKFRELADTFIHLANEHSETVPHDKLGAAFLYGAARFNAFVAYVESKSRAQFSGDKEKAVAFFLMQYEKMLREHLDDHETHYDRFKGGE
ncbi:MAG: DUF3144 domain-containing protein [Burkholderiales bacterium]